MPGWLEGELMLTLGVITDLHFGPNASYEGKLRKLSHRAPELTRAFAERMRDTVHPDLVVNLGDAIEDESPEADATRYAECLELLRGAGSELVCVAGNHDRVHLSAEHLRRAWGMDPEGPLYRSFDRGGIHLVVLYSHERKDRDVILGDEQLAWLAEDLARTALPVVVLVHHSAAEQDVSENRWFAGFPHICLIADRARLRELLAAHRRVLLVMNGHLHWNHVDVIEGIPYVTLQSLIENVEDDAPGTAAAAHAVVKIDDRSVHITVGGAQPVRYQFERTSQP
jgi:calcineurin-like phosphoesterase family protein